MKKLLICGLPALTLLACSPAESPEASGKELAQNHRSISVRLAKVMPYDGEVTLQYSGVVEANEMTPLSFATTGNVSEVLVNEGDYVTKGQLLAKLDQEMAKNAYDLASQQHQRAQDAYNRLKPMKENGTLPEIDWVEMETNLAQTTTAVAMAQNGIDDCFLKAPRSGVVGSKSITPGMNILPNSTAIQLLDIQSVLVKIPVSEDEIGSLQKGQKARVFIGALGQESVGAIEEIGVSADLLSHTYPVKIEVQNENRKIKPGMVCEVDAILSDEDQGMLVSEKALQLDIEGNQFVYVHQNGNVQKRFIKTIKTLENHLLVSGDLKPGEEVVVAGQQKLVPGLAVNVIR
ncbi:efflux RND transporter periplasmic adaptor subunit [bacterium SCSIO 12741]|nr:efflux RND transporter periplasmic adaptor subunit [bacterium SCSIO 12741]